MKKQAWLGIMALVLAALFLSACDVTITVQPPPGVTGKATTAAPSAATTTAASNGNASQGDHRLFVEPDDGVTPVVNGINSAKTTLEIKMYLLSDREVIAAIQDAQKRGVAVRVMLEQNPYGSGPGNESVYKSLQQAGVQMKWTNPAFRLTHEKSMVVDGKEAYIMTTNLTHSAFTQNREYDIITTKAAEVKEVLDGFNADWDRTKFTPPDGSPLLWSNINSRKKILAFVDGAQKSLDMEQEEMQDSEVQQHLVNAVKRGVKVRVLVAAAEGGGQDANLPGEQQIKAGGVEVKTITSPYMHAKIYLADGNRVIVCSENVSTSSLNNNRELGIEVSDANIVQRIGQTFEKDWPKGKAVS